MNVEFLIGRYTLSGDVDSEEVVWLTRDGGEGMEVDRKEIEKVLHEYFEENF